MRKTLATLLTLAVTLPLTAAIAQPRPTARLGLSTLSAGNLAWYRQRLRPMRPLPAGARPVVFGQATRGGQTSMVGLNFTAAGQPFRTTARRTQNGGRDEVCEVEGIAMDYLKQSTFNLYRYDPSSTIFPGSFVDARSIMQVRPQFVSATNRAPVSVRISISNPLSGAPDSVSIADFSANNLGTLHGMLRDKHFGAAFPALIVAKTEEVRSAEEMSAHLDASYGLALPLEEFGLPVDVSYVLRGSADGSTAHARHTYVMTLVQPMYSYGVTMVDKSRLFTTPGATAVHQNTLMVGSITFGRRVVIVVESDSSITHVEAAISPKIGITFTGEEGVFQLGGEVNANADATFSRVVKNFRASFYGGNAGRANAVVRDPSKVAEFLTDPSAARLSRTTGEMPLDYTLEPVGTDGTIGVRSTGAFDATSCVEPVYKVEVRYVGLQAMRVVEGPGDSQEDIFGTISVGGKRLKSIPENAAQSIALNARVDDDVRMTISDRMTLGELRALRLTFAQTLKDWEVLTKPEYKPLEPLELQYAVDAVRDRIDRALRAERDGDPMRLDTNTQVIDLYENGDRNGSHIGIRFEVYVTRR